MLSQNYSLNIVGYKAEHECTCELPGFILMSILHAILLTWILMGLTIWVTQIHKSSTCAM